MWAGGKSRREHGHAEITARRSPTPRLREQAGELGVVSTWTLREGSHRGGTRSRRRWCYPAGAGGRGKEANEAARPRLCPSAMESPLETWFGLRSFSHGLTEHRREGLELGANRQMTCSATVIALKCTEHGCTWHALSHTEQPGGSVMIQHSTRGSERVCPKSHS